MFGYTHLGWDNHAEAMLWHGLVDSSWHLVFEGLICAWLRRGSVLLGREVQGQWQWQWMEAEACAVGVVRKNGLVRLCR